MLTKALFAIGIILIAFVMSFFGFKEVVDVMATARLDYILLAVALQIAILLLLAVRLVLLSRKYSHLGFREAFKISMSGMAVSMITPIAKIGGEPLKIYLLKKNRFKGSQATAVIAVDTLAELASSLLVVFFVFVFFSREIPGILASSFAIFLVVIAAILVLFVKLLLNPRWMRRLVHFVTKRVSRFAHVKKKDYAELFYKAFLVLINDRKLIASAFGLSFVTKIIEFARIWFVFAAISIFLPADVIVIFWSVILVLYLIPWLPGSLGLVEFFGAGVLVFFGIASSAAAGGLLLDRFISYWFVLVLGLGIMTTMPLPKRLKK